MVKEQSQPSQGEIRTAIMLFQGPVLLLRAFKQSGPTRLRSVSSHEFETAVNVLTTNDDKGTAVSLTIPRQRKCLIFVKKNPNEMVFQNEDNERRYHQRYNEPIHCAISEGMRTQLRQLGHLANE